MNRIAIGVLAAALLAGAVQAQPPGPHPTPPDPKALTYILPAKIPWTEDPRMKSLGYVIYGDPTKPGPYAILVTWPAHRMSRPHMHPHDRHVTVISGTWWVGTGPDFSPDTTTPIPAGSIVTHYAHQLHYDGAKDEPVVLEITGEGPQ